MTPSDSTGSPAHPTGPESGTGDPEETPAPDGSRPIIAAIGASAGGVKALQGFFSALPEGLGVSFVVVTHLAPDQRSQLAEVLGDSTRLPVTQVTDAVPIEPDRVYVVPPDRELHVTDDEVSARPFAEGHLQRTPIDTFFRSFARTYGDGFGILLSGGGSDGSVGLKAVKEGGGLVLVQDPTEAEYGSMPRSAIATGLADLVLPVRELAARMPDLVRAKRRLRDDPEALGDEEVLRRILALLRTRTGHDFSQYKRATVLRRLARRMQVTRTERYEDYLAYLRGNVEEAQALFEDLLISVTTFFRDPEAFEALAETVVPRLFDEAAEGEPIRVWVPGCATGEEAYSLAILLLEEAARRGVHPNVQVFATDLDEGALATAREGRYPDAIAADVSEERLLRFFSREGDHYCVQREVRDCVLIASHSLLRDPPFSRLDLVSCRNLLIYLDRELQNQVFDLLQYALRPGGYLFLGSSETAASGPFRALDKEHRLYQAHEQPEEGRPPLPDLLLYATPRPRRVVGRPGPRPGREGTDALHRQALEDLGPPSVLVDEDRRAVHLSETAGRYLLQPGGAPTTDVTELVRRELQVELRAALHAAFYEGATSVSLPIPVRFDETPRNVQVVVRPLRPREDEERLALVLFVEGSPSAVPGEVPALGADADETLRRLSDELREVRGQLTRTREESTATAEELRASNEELQSMNEEYRSATEELETSKEELQSVNEELETVNAELKKKLAEVSRAHDDLRNLMAATEVGTLFLDPALRIKRTTPRVADLFSVTEADRGRPITDFTHRLDYPELEADVHAVLKNLAPVEREVRSHDDRWYLVRLRPYRTAEDRIDGVVVTFVDFTARKEAQEALRQSEERYRLVVESVQEYAILTMAPEGQVTSWNQGARRIFGYGTDEIIGRSGTILFTEEERAAGVPEEEMAKAAREGEAIDERWHVRKDGARFWGSGVMTALRFPPGHREGELRGFTKVLRDNTARREAAEKLRESEERLRDLNETLERRVRERTRQVRSLASTLTRAEQEERRRISMILHDDLQQRLYGVQIHLKVAQQAAPEATGALDKASEELDDAVHTARTLAVDLSPPVLKDEGLREALLWLARRMEDAYGLTVEVKAAKAFRMPDEDMRVLLFQLIRELLFNVVKHAGVARAAVEVEDVDDYVAVHVVDVGRGFDLDEVMGGSAGSKGFGLYSVRERLDLFGGRVEIVSAPGAGTRVSIYAPVEVAPDDADEREDEG